MKSWIGRWSILESSDPQPIHDSIGCSLAIETIRRIEKAMTLVRELHSVGRDLNFFTLLCGQRAVNVEGLGEDLRV